MNRQPRVAWISPLPPDATGVADYSADILRALTDRFELTLVHPRVEILPAMGASAQTPAEWLARDAADPCDLALYQMGNHALHEWIWRLARVRPGLVVSHDASYLDLFYSVYAAGGDQDGYLDALLAEHGAGGFRHGQRLLAGIGAGETSLAPARAGRGWFARLRSRFSARRAPPPSPANADATPTLLGTALGDPLRVIVHNRTALRAVERAVSAPVSLVPHYFDPGGGYPPRGSVEAAGAGLPAGVPLILSLGFLNPNKRIERVLDALGRVARTGRDFRFVIAGEIPDSLAPGVVAAIRETGLAHRVIRTGYVSAERMRRLLSVCDFAINLRYPGGGESSGSLIRMLGAGMPVIVTDHGSAAEFPGDIVRMVPHDEREHDALMAAIIDFLDDPASASAMGERAARYIREYHSLSQIRDRYAAEIMQAIADRARPGFESARRLREASVGDFGVAGAPRPQFHESG